MWLMTKNFIQNKTKDKKGQKEIKNAGNVPFSQWLRRVVSCHVYPPIHDETQVASA
jgi:hypothetical protein